MKLKPYPKYKDSGIQWIGEIPEEWEVRKSSSFGFFSSSGINKKTEPYEDLVKMVNYTDIYGNNSLVIDSKRELMTVSCPKGKVIYCNLKKGDIVFTPSSETEEDIGLSAVVLEDLKNTVFSYHVIKFRPIININLLYKKYIGNNHYVLSQFSRTCKGTTRQILTHNDFKNILMILPPLPDQTAIASLLDKKTAKINALIEKNKKLIAIFKEKRTALINHAVTKGLDPNVKMKKVNLITCHETPENWQIIRIKFILRLSRGVDLSNDNFKEGNIPVYGSNGIIGYHNKATSKGPGVIIGRSGSVGKVNFVSEENYWAHNTSLYLQENYGNNVRYIYYLLSILDLKHLAAGSAVGTLNRNNIHAIFISLPSKSEQQEIVDNLDKATSKIDKTIKLIENKLKLLEEYKKSLIYHAVTGKIDVREAVA